MKYFRQENCCTIILLQPVLDKIFNAIPSITYYSQCKSTTKSLFEPHIPYLVLMGLERSSIALNVFKYD